MEQFRVFLRTTNDWYLQNIDPNNLTEFQSQQVMLSFPSQNWEKALGSTKAKFNLNGLPGYGRLASCITSRLYLSDLWTATNTERLSELGITHVVSVLEARPDLPEFIPQDRRLHVPIADQFQANILRYLDTTTTFITEALEESENNKVLVHCVQGISRSATVVCAYLIATTDMTAEGSIEFVQSIRGIVCPNIGFRQQLKEYSTQYVKLKRRPMQITFSEICRLCGVTTGLRKSRNAKGIAGEGT